jgi:hypothetical protein
VQNILDLHKQVVGHVVVQVGGDRPHLLLAVLKRVKRVVKQKFHFVTLQVILLMV